MMMFPELAKALQSQQARQSPKPAGSSLGGPGGYSQGPSVNASPGWQSTGNRSAGASNFSPAMQAHVRNANAQEDARMGGYSGDGSGFGSGSMVNRSAFPSMSMFSGGSSPSSGYIPGGEGMSAPNPTSYSRPQGPTHNMSLFKQPGSSLGGPGGYGFQAGPQAAMSDHMSMFKQPSSLGGPGGYSQQQGPQVNQPYGGLRRAMMNRFRPREQMFRRGGR